MEIVCFSIEVYDLIDMPYKRTLYVAFFVCHLLHNHVSYSKSYQIVEKILLLSWSLNTSYMYSIRIANF